MSKSLHTHCVRVTGNGTQMVIHSIERKYMNIVPQTKNEIVLFSASGNKFYCAVSSLYGLINDIFWPFCINNGPNENVYF